MSQKMMRRHHTGNKCRLASADNHAFQFFYSSADDEEEAMPGNFGTRSRELCEACDPRVYFFSLQLVPRDM
jgi:hypothetical protein